jgi:hypothetical protein
MAEFGSPVELPERYEAGRRLSKRRYASGTRCPKRLWLETHEPDAPELLSAPIPTVLFEQGRRCGELARAAWPAGVLVGDGRVAAFDLERAAAETRRLIDAGASVLFEAAFVTPHAVAVVDILERVGDDWRLIEVKQASECKPEHVADVAFQLHVLGECGLVVREAAVMHLNRDCRAPDLSTLFVTADVTATASALAATLASPLDSFASMLANAMPEPGISAACVSPAPPCPFKPRCWVGVPEHHVSTLYMMKKKEAFEHHAAGRLTVMEIELPTKKKPSATARVQWRQQEALQTNARIVEREALSAALRTLAYPVAMLDFETVMLAVPVWDGCAPNVQVPVQFSCHTIAAPGAPAKHAAWLARPGEDPRPGIAAALVAACEGAVTVMAYNASFEAGCLKHLAEWVPSHAEPLMAIHDRIVDLLPMVRENVYDPAFGGSFSIKKVLPALVPELSYDGLAIAKGDVAAQELARVLFAGDEMTSGERERVTEALLAYCERDTEAMVALHRALERMVEG